MSDISSEEGDLFRFTRICRIIGGEQLPSSQVVESIREDLGLSSDIVIGRHLSILQRIGLVIRRNGDLLNTGDGRVLLRVTGTPHPKSYVLPPEERIIYFRALVPQALWQVRQMLRTYHYREGVNLLAAGLSYFQEYLNHGQTIWNRSSIRKSIESSNSSRILSSSLRNKFVCVRKWLVQLGLLVSDPSGFNLSDSGLRVLEILEEDEAHLRPRIFRVASELLPPSGFVEFNLEDVDHVSASLRLLREASTLFQREIGMTDYRSARLYTSIQLLLRNHVVLEENEYYSLIGHLWSEGHVKEVFSGRNGRPAYVILSSRDSD